MAPKRASSSYVTRVKVDRFVRLLLKRAVWQIEALNRRQSARSSLWNWLRVELFLITGKLLPTFDSQAAPLGAAMRKR
jgi:hypothetical protein